MLEKELKFLYANKDKLLKAYGSKFIVIKGEDIGGAYDTMSQALQGAALAYGTENVLIRRATDTDVEISIPALTLGILNADIPRSSRGTRQGTRR
jgi:hypothetical protein